MSLKKKIGLENRIIRKYILIKSNSITRMHLSLIAFRKYQQDGVPHQQVTIAIVTILLVRFHHPGFSLVNIN